MRAVRLAALLAAALAALLLAFPAAADLRLRRVGPREGPMRILHAKAVDPACGANCPEWLSVEGQIMPGSGAAFTKAIADLHGRKLPILLSSHGGSVGDAVAMG